MKEKDFSNDGLKNLIARYRRVFHLPENVDYYSKQDFKNAERQFIKFMLKNQELSNAPPRHS